MAKLDCKNRFWDARISNAEQRPTSRLIRKIWFSRSCLRAVVVVTQEVLWRIATFHISSQRRHNTELGRFILRLYDDISQSLAKERQQADDLQCASRTCQIIQGRRREF